MADQEKTKRPRDNKKGRRPSSTGKRQPKVDQVNWRARLQTSRIKFDDDQKEIYLREFAEHGMKGRAAKAAGVSMQCVRDHVENDPDFAELRDESEESYHDRVIDHHANLLFEGELRKKYNKDGDLIEEHRVFPIQLLLAEIKKVDPRYREKQTIDLNHGGGVMIAPAEMTPAEWLAASEKRNEAKEPPEGATLADDA